MGGKTSRKELDGFLWTREHPVGVKMRLQLPVRNARLPDFRDFHELIDAPETNHAVAGHTHCPV